MRTGKPKIEVPWETFDVKLKEGSVSVKARSFVVNHRGDLIFTSVRTVNEYQAVASSIAAFKSGIWMQVIKTTPEVSQLTEPLP